MFICAWFMGTGKVINAQLMRDELWFSVVVWIPSSDHTITAIAMKRLSWCCTLLSINYAYKPRQSCSFFTRRFSKYFMNRRGSLNHPSEHWLARGRKTFCNQIKVWRIHSSFEITSSRPIRMLGVETKLNPINTSTILLKFRIGC